MDFEDRALVATNAEPDFIPVTRAEVVSFDQDLAIDEDHLDWEWKRQPDLHIKIARFRGRAHMALVRARNELKTRSAQLNMRFRREGIPGITRVTDEAIKNAVIADTEIQELENRVGILESIFLYVDDLRKTCEGRISSLNGLTRVKPQRVSPEAGEVEGYVETSVRYARDRLSQGG